MTFKEFADRAVRAAQRDLGIPAGWWGVYRDVTNGRARVTFTGSCWRVIINGRLVSRHDSRSVAIAKARRL